MIQNNKKIQTIWFPSKIKSMISVETLKIKNTKAYKQGKIVKYS